jgi:hypothetical protein
MNNELELEKLPNGDLKIVLTDEGREVLGHDVHEDAYPDLNDLMEYWLCNGWELLNPEDIGALTSCPFIYTDDAEQDDNGDYTRIGRVYWYPQYEVHNPVQRLDANGFIILEGVE